jgi:replicative DNA helicase
MEMTLTEKTLQAQRYTEHLFAGAIFTDPAYAIQTCGWLQPEHIRDERVRDYWRAVLAGVEPTTAAIEAKCYTEILTWLLDSHAQDIEAYAREIQRREYLASCDPLLQNVMAARAENDIPAMRDAINQLVNHLPETKEIIPDAVDAALEFLSYLDRPSIGVKTYIPNVDKLIGSLECGTFSILAARPSMGKSTIAFQIARNNARNGHKVLMFSNETRRVRLMAKAACGALAVSWPDVRERNVSPGVIEEIRAKAMELGESYGFNLRIDDRMHHTTQSIWQEIAAYQPELVIIDILANLHDKGESEIRRLSAIARNLKQICGDLNCHLMALHHINRDVEKRDVKVPTMSDLRDCGDLEQAADVVLFLHSDAYYEQKALPEVIETDLIVAKNRDDQRNSRAKLNFLAKQQWFEPRGL